MKMENPKKAALSVIVGMGKPMKNENDNMEEDKYTEDDSTEQDSGSENCKCVKCSCGAELLCADCKEPACDCNCEE